MIKGAKSIAEYAIRKWLDREGFVMDCFAFKMTGPQEAVIKDRNGDQMRLIYNPTIQMVIPLDLTREEP